MTDGCTDRHTDRHTGRQADRQTQGEGFGIYPSREEVTLGLRLFLHYRVTPPHRLNQTKSRQYHGQQV